MELLRFSLQRFRNLEDPVLEPSAGMNVICGENAQGKTNLLEALYVLSTLKSFRTHHLQEALRFGEDDALLQGTIRQGQGKRDLAISVQKKGKVALLDRKKADALQYLGVFHVFLFSFPMLEVVRGGPEERRRFVDRGIAVSRPGYLQELMQYHRAMKQKNALLGMLQRGETGRREGIEEVLSFNRQLLEHGLKVVAHRVAYLDRLQELLCEKQRLFFEKDMGLGIKLVSSFLSDTTEAERLLERSTEREIARGVCLVGAHRDEIRFSVNGRELRKYGSSGQHRAFLLLLLLAQLELYESWRSDRPLLLLDDLDSELDQRRIRAFLGEIGNRYQTFISSSRKDLFENGENLRFYRMEAGRVLEM